MKPLTIICIVLAVAVILVAVLWLNTNTQKSKLSMQKDSINAAFEMATNTISEIQANLDSIDSGLTGQLLASGETPKQNADTRSQIITRLKDIRTRIAADKKRIAVLEKQMAKSNVKIKGLEDIVANLKKSLTEKEQIVNELSAQIGLYADSLSTERKISKETIALKEALIAEKLTLLENKDKDLNTIYYAIGTRKELIEDGIIKRKGGFLGIGRTSVIQKTELEKYATIDLREFESLTFPATKRGYSVLTNQNAASYTVEKAGDSHIMLITDKGLFRKYKILVIELL
jgi:hypothetical protein